MKHGKGYRKLSKPTDQRMAMFKSMVESLFEHGKITTTITRAKEARRFAERVVTWAKKGDLSSIRQAAKIIRNKTLLKTVFTEMPKRFGERSGGYTRIVKIGMRRGDAAPMVLLELC